VNGVARDRPAGCIMVVAERAAEVVDMPELVLDRFLELR
jgi:hypothetical protein